MYCRLITVPAVLMIMIMIRWSSSMSVVKAGGPGSLKSVQSMTPPQSPAAAMITQKGSHPLGKRYKALLSGLATLVSNCGAARRPMNAEGAITSSRSISQPVCFYRIATAEELSAPHLFTSTSCFRHPGHPAHTVPAFLAGDVC